jgi:hypothetical protein
MYWVVGMDLKRKGTKMHVEISQGRKFEGGRSYGGRKDLTNATSMSSPKGKTTANNLI